MGLGERRRSDLNNQGFADLLGQRDSSHGDEDMQNEHDQLLQKNDDDNHLEDKNLNNDDDQEKQLNEFRVY